MTREQAREHINGLMATQMEAAPKEANGYPTYICPFCGNGSGENGTGICTKDGVQYKCFKCDFFGDYLSILKREMDAKNELEVFVEYGLEVEGVEAVSSVGLDGEFSEENRDTDPIYLARKALQYSNEAQQYLLTRGISLKTANSVGIGYSPKWRSPTALKKGKNPPASKRIIISTGDGNYLARAMDCSVDDNFKMMKEGAAGIFNKRVLRFDNPVYVTEGAFDALSIIEVGGEAVAIGSTSSVDLFLNLCKTEPPTAPLILSLDNDEAGRKAQEKLKAGLKSLSISFSEVNTAARYKDPNEHLTANREVFSSIINSPPDEAREIIDEIMKQASDEEKAEYLQTSAAYHLNALMGEIAASADTPAISTGFNLLDDALDGGLYEGLYIVGAISSIGKTTFILQAADQIAQNGFDILIFSLEMSRYELMAKSISRLTLMDCTGDLKMAKTTRGILAGAKRKFYSQREKDLINKSITAYGEYSVNIYIHEGVGTIGVNQIKAEVERHIKNTGNRPVVIIDYLQILSPYDLRMNDKQNTDHSVLELKRLSRDKKIPIIAISSFNRENYTAPVNMASFKESGAIEYSSDVLLGLQLTGMDELSQGETKKAETLRKLDEMKRAEPRKAQLKILKNRNGQIGKNLYYNYYQKFNYFQEVGGNEK